MNLSNKTNTIWYGSLVLVECNMAAEYFWLGLSLSIFNNISIYKVKALNQLSTKYVITYVIRNGLYHYSRRSSFVLNPFYSGYTEKYNLYFC